MKKVIGVLVGTLLCSLAATASSAESSERISRVATLDTNQALVVASDGAWDGNLCADNAWLVIDTTTVSGREMFNTALAAHLAGKVVKAFYSTCSGSFPKATRIDIVGN